MEIQILNNRKEKGEWKLISICVESKNKARLWFRLKTKRDSRLVSHFVSKRKHFQGLFFILFQNESSFKTRLSFRFQTKATSRVKSQIHDGGNEKQGLFAKSTINGELLCYI